MNGEEMNYLKDDFTLLVSYAAVSRLLSPALS